jgi:hypothetical protein
MEKKHKEAKPSLVLKILLTFFLFLVVNSPVFACYRCISSYMVYPWYLSCFFVILLISAGFFFSKPVIKNLIVIMCGVLVVAVLLLLGVRTGFIAVFCLIPFFILAEVIALFLDKAADRQIIIAILAIVGLWFLSNLVINQYVVARMYNDGKTRSSLVISFDYSLCQSHIQNIGTAIEEYAADNNHQYPENLQKLVPGYFVRRLPRCMREECSPEGGKIYEKFNNINTGDYGYSLSEDRKRFTVYCAKNNHAPIGIREGFPQYSSKEGFRSH